MEEIFEFKDYKALLRAAFAHRKITMAAAARQTGYQRSFLSRVLNAELHLTTEAAFKMAALLRFTPDQTLYLFWLVESARAGDPKYRGYAQARALEIKKAHEEKEKSQSAPILQTEAYFLEYLSSWIPVAVHLATAIRGTNSVSQISQRLSLSANLVESALTFLVANGLAEKRGSEYFFKSGSLHISENSAWLQFHLSNWRMRALADAQAKIPTAIHFTNVLTLSSDDVDRIRELINRAVDEAMRIARPSPPEAMVCLNVDYFRLI